MGCGSSKIDDLPAVVLCSQRLAFLDEALQHRYSLAQSHLDYLDSLKSVAESLHRFLSLAATDLDGSSPVLNLPPRRKGDPDGRPVAKGGPRSGDVVVGGHHLSHSNSGSHLHFHSDSDDDSGSEGFHHLPSPSPLHPDFYGGGVQEGGYLAPEAMMAPYPGVYTHMNFMRKQPAPSVSYEWRPTSPERVRMGESSTSSSNYPQYSYSTYQNPSSGSSFYNPPNPYGYTNYYGGGDGGGGGGGGGGIGSFFGSSLPPPPYGSPPGRQMGAASPSSSNSKPLPPPPPPPPPASSAWDFLNPFESIETSYPPYTPSSRDSREVREEEGIPDLEEDYQHEVVKEVHGDQKFVDGDGGGGAGGGGKRYSKAVVEEGDMRETDEAVLYKPLPSPVVVEPDPGDFGVHMVDKKVVGEEGRSEDHGNGSLYTGGRHEFRSVSDPVKEIQLQFERASASGSELVKILEVGKLPYQRKNAAYQVSSKMLQALTPSFRSTSNGVNLDLDLDGNVELRSLGLSSTMQKLYLWEKKLLEEVKVEEKMRVVHDRNVQKLKRLDQRGAEAHKVDKTRTLVQSLSTKIRIAIQVVDKISVKINKLRDEELWPQLNELIQGLARMWKAMLECHHSQWLVVEGARGLDGIAFPNVPDDAHLEATMRLEHDLLNWTMRFSNWVESQRYYVRALNSWLLKCLLYEPEETADGVAPFSPGRAGAPPVFVICFQWCQALERISEKEVVESMKVFAMMVFQFWERDKVAMQQRMMMMGRDRESSSKDMERKVKHLDKEDMKIQKEIRALDKKISMLSGGDADGPSGNNIVYQSDTRSSNSNLQSGLRHMFESMDRFVQLSVKAYDELLLRSVEVVREHAKVS
ncbi:hypothetical protein Dimus_025875 [Dionaea muscipula]